jgi:hypothetical protein
MLSRNVKTKTYKTMISSAVCYGCGTLFLILREEHSSFGIAEGYEWTAGVRFPAEATYFSLLNSVQTGSGAQPASYPMGIRGPFSGGKATGA